MSGFSIDWLNLREAADRAARDAHLQQQAAGWLAAAPRETRADARSFQELAPAAGPTATGDSKNPVVVDLGAGTGSTLRALSSVRALSVVNPEWRLVDLDGQLLAEAERRHSRTHRLKCHRLDLTRVTELPLTGARLVTASALFDLASRDFCDALVAQLAVEHTALYAALNYDGLTQWTPEHSLDAAVLEAFNRDQLRDKGFGPALGPGATDYLAARMAAAGFSVFTAVSPWRLAAADRVLVEELITGIAGAVAPVLDPVDLEEWRHFRLHHAATGICVVGHRDLLALPERVV